MGSEYLILFAVLLPSPTRSEAAREFGLTLWDGTLGGLRSATFEQSLRPVERFHIVDNYEIAANLRGIEIQIFLAYQIPGEIVYLPQPLQLRFTD